MSGCGPGIMKDLRGKLIVWPAYIDSSLSRAQGRRIPVSLAVPNVTIQMLAEAAKLSGIDAEVEAEKRYPRNWTGNAGRLIVNNREGHKKKRILLTLAKGARKIVARQETERIMAEKKSKKKRR